LLVEKRLSITLHANRVSRPSFKPRARARGMPSMSRSSRPRLRKEYFRMKGKVGNFENLFE